MRALRMTVVVGLMTLLGGALVPGVAGASAAGARDSGPSIAVEQIHPTPTGAHYFVRVTGGNGGTATVTATPTGPDGKAGAPVTLEDGGEPNLYQGGVEMPQDGSWTVNFTSKNPDATLDYKQKIPAETFTAGSGSDSGSGDSSDDPSPVVPLIFAGLFVLALAAMGVWALMERRKPGAATAEGGDADAGPGDDSGPGGDSGPEADAGSDESISASTD